MVIKNANTYGSTARKRQFGADGYNFYWRIIMLKKEKDALNIDPFMGDMGDQKIISNKIVTTRKEHRCNECNKTIDIGARARNHVDVFDGEIGSYYFHIDCLLEKL